MIIRWFNRSFLSVHLNNWRHWNWLFQFIWLRWPSFNHIVQSMRRTDDRHFKIECFSPISFHKLINKLSLSLVYLVIAPNKSKMQIEIVNLTDTLHGAKMKLKWNQSGNQCEWFVDRLANNLNLTLYWRLRIRFTWICYLLLTEHIIGQITHIRISNVWQISHSSHTFGQIPFGIRKKCIDKAQRLHLQRLIDSFRLWIRINGAFNFQFKCWLSADCKLLALKMQFVRVNGKWHKSSARR